MTNCNCGNVVELEVLGNYIGSAYSPTVAVEDIEGGHRVTFTYETDGGLTTASFNVMDGDPTTPGCVDTEALADDAVTRQKVKDGAINIDKLDVAVKLTVTNGDLTISLE